MKKAIFKKSLALLLSLMVLLTALGGAMAVFADDAAAGDATIPEDYVLAAGGSDLVGTEEEGIHGEYTAFGYLHAKVILGLPNADFQKGFQYWAGKTNEGPSVDFNLVTEANGNKYIQFNGSQADTYKGLATPDIAISDEYLNDGDQLALIFKYKATENDWQNVFSQRCLVEGDNAVRTANYNVKKLGYLADGWAIGATQSNLTVVARSDKTFPGGAQTGYYTFYICMENTTTTATSAFDDFEIVKVVNDKYYNIYTGEEIVYKNGTNTGAILFGSNDLVGTEEAGITDVYGDDSKFHAKVIEGIPNGDFSQGLKYWAGNTAEGVTADMSLVTDADGNKYIQFNGSQASTYKGLRSPDIAVADEYIDDGDELALIFDYKGDNSDWQNVFGQRNSSAAEIRTNKNNAKKLAYNNGWITGAIQTNLVVGTRTSTQTYPGTLNSGYYTFKIVMENTNTSATTAFDNFRIAKVVDGKYYDLYTGEQLVFTSTSYPDGQQIGGTVEAGLNTSGSAIGNYKLDAPADFTNGFKYWSSKNDRNGTAADQFELVVDDEGDYAFTVKSTNATYDGIETYRFSLEEGKTYAIMYDYKLNASLTDNISDLIGSQPISIFFKGSSVQSNSVGTGTLFGTWTTDISGTVTAAAGTDYYIQIQVNGKTGAEIYAAVTDGEAPFLIKNIKIVEVLSSGNYLDVATGTELYSNGQVIGGTAQDGIVPDYKYSTKLYVGMNGATGTSYYGSTEGFNNGDFSDGLRFWAAKYDRVGYLLADGVSIIDKASDIAEIVDGKLTIKPTYAGVADDMGNVTGAVQYAGVQSAPFTLKDSGIMVGDKLYFRLDALTTGGAKVQFVSKNSGSITVQPYNTTAWETHVSKPSYSEETNTWSNQIIVSSLDEVYALVVEVGDTVGGTQFDNFQILRADRGGVDKAVTLDGKLLAGDLYGDANGDGKVDLVDLVRAKKHAIDNSTPVFTAAADIDLSGVVDANDYIEIIDYILGTKAPAEGVA